MTDAKKTYDDGCVEGYNEALSTIKDHLSPARKVKGSTYSTVDAVRPLRGPLGEEVQRLLEELKANAK